MANNKPKPPDRDHEPLSPDEIATLREMLPHAETIVEGAVSRDRWRWLRSLLGSMITWAAAALALLFLLQDRFFGGAPR